MHKHYRKIKLPVFNPKPVEEHEHKEHKEKHHEEPIEDDTHKYEKEYKKIKLPVFKPKPKPIEPEKVCVTCNMSHDVMPPGGRLREDVTLL